MRSKAARLFWRWDLSSRDSPRARKVVDHPYAGVGLVLVLSTLAAGAEGLDFAVADRDGEDGRAVSHVVQSLELVWRGTSCGLVRRRTTLAELSRFYSSAPK